MQKWPCLPTDLMLSHDNIGVVPPPMIQTVKKTMRRVVVNIIWRAYDAVSRMASANAIAPLRPAGTGEEDLVTTGERQRDIGRVAAPRG